MALGSVSPSTWAYTFASFAALAACSGTAGDPRGAGTSKVGQLDSTSASFSTFTPVNGGHLVSAEVDDSGNAFVLSEGTGVGEDPGFFQIVEFDPTGAAHGGAVVANRDRHLFRELRVRAGLVGVGARAGGPHYDAPRLFDPYQMLVYVGGFMQLKPWIGPQTTDAAHVDACADGTVVASSLVGSDAAVVKLDGDANVVWQTNVPGTAPAKVRCSANGAIDIVGVTTDDSSSASAAKLESDGTLAWTWRGSDANVAPSGFDRDSKGDLFAIATSASGQDAFYRLYAVDPGGNLIYAWASDGPNEGPASVSADDAGNAIVVGSRGARGSRHFYAVALDAAGNVLWTRDEPAANGIDAYALGAALDGSDNAFLCGVAGGGQAVLYGPGGSTAWSYVQPNFTPLAADVTGAVGRCLGTTLTSSGSYGVAVLSFPLP